MKVSATRQEWIAASCGGVKVCHRIRWQPTDTRGEFDQRVSTL